MTNADADRAGRPGLPRLGAGLAELAAGKDLLFCDVWGVLHNGVRAFPAAVDALYRFRARGGTVILVTNAPVLEAQVRTKLDRLGIGRTACDRIVTAGDVAVQSIVAAGCPPLFGIGPPGEDAIYREAARLGPHPPPLVDAEAAMLAVCVGLDATGERPEHYDPVLARLRARNLEMICANPDIVVEVGDELVFCAGAIAERYAALGGRVVQAGKPFAGIYERARALAAAIRGAVSAADRTLAVGDALRTDIEGAARQGVESVLVTAGIHRARLHRRGELDDAALAQFLGEHAARPTAAMPQLVW